jgi:hypothetical protein
MEELFFEGINRNKYPAKGLEISRLPKLLESQFAGELGLPHENPAVIPNSTNAENF